MKRFSVLMLSAMLVLSLAACSGKKETTDTEETKVEENAASSASSVVDADEGDGFVRPENYGTVKLGDYKGLEVTVADTEVTDEDVQAEIDNALANYPAEVTGRAVQDGDILDIDYEGKKDGVAFEGGTAQGASLTIGSGQFIAGFEDGLIGAEVGETRDLKLKFPDDYWSEDLAGKDVVFTVTVNKISAPADEITDAWVQDYTAGECKTIDEFKTTLRADLEKYEAQSAVEDVKAVLLQDILDSSEFTPSQEAIDYEFDRIKLSYQSYVLQSFGTTLEDYMAGIGMDQETFEGELKSYAELAVKQQLVVDEIFNEEGMKIEEADEQALADLYGVSLEEIRTAYVDGIYEQNVKTNKVLQFVLDNAVQK